MPSSDHDTEKGAKAPDSLPASEVGEMSPRMQVELLRVLQEREVERVGGRKPVPVDIRVLATSNRDMASEAKAGRFREDLYYRLAEIVLEIPPLRARKGDASLLTHAFVRKFADEQRSGTLTLLPDAVDAIEAYEWPGNVRELENRTKRAVIMAEGSTLRVEDFGLQAVAPEPEMFNLRRARDEAERDAIVRVLGRVNGNISKAAELLGVSRPTLYDLMSKYAMRSSS